MIGLENTMLPSFVGDISGSGTALAMRLNDCAPETLNIFIHFTYGQNSKTIIHPDSGFKKISYFSFSFYKHGFLTADMPF